MYLCDDTVDAPRLLTELNVDSPQICHFLEKRTHKITTVVSFMQPSLHRTWRSRKLNEIA